MKVGTLTFPGSPSHGASLQMYALYSVLSDMGVDTEVINYVSDSVNHKNHTKKILKDRIAGLFLRDSMAAFRQFEKRVKIYPEDSIKTTHELKQYTEAYDRIIVGSDQVWNPVVTGNDMNFYLDFCNDKSKKASYAPSFGVNQIDEKDKEKISRLLSDFTYLSAREERGKELIYELTQKEVPLVLDPTFLLDGDDWRKIKKPSGAKGEYVFVYTIKPSMELKQKAKCFADKHGYKLVYISGGLHGVLDKINPHKHPVFGIGPAEFIDLVDNAQYVFTNSFHGAAFSIILNKKFYVELSSDTNSRLITLIQKFGLENCIIDCKTYDSRQMQIDYVKVNQILAIKRKESMLYLEGIVN
jgi:hypothetical protein